MTLKSLNLKQEAANEIQAPESTAEVESYAGIIGMMMDLASELKLLRLSLEEVQRAPLERIARQWIEGEQVMACLKIGTRTLQNMRTEGQLLFARLNGKIYYRVSDIEALLMANYGLNIKNDEL